jgi:RHS repeat-associated protein
MTTQLFDPGSDSVIQQTTDANSSDPTTTDYLQGPNGIVSADPTTDNNDASITYYGEDALGSVVALTNGSGASTDEYAYDAFGQNLVHTGSSVQPFTFMGNQTDTTTGLDDFNAREYDPALGSFLSEDPVSGNIEDPSTLDAYAYGVDDPYGEPDPSGMATSADFLNPFSGNNELMNPAAPSGYYLVIGISEGGLDQGDIENEGIGEYTGYGFAFAEGFVNGAGAWSSALSRIWRWSDNPESRSLASQLIKTAGPEAAALESVSKYAGLAGIAFEGVINVAQEGVLKGTVNTGFEVAGAATGAVLGSAICATETVATAGWGAIACPLIVGSLSAGFSYLGDKAFGAVNSVVGGF